MLSNTVERSLSVIVALMGAIRKEEVQGRRRRRESRKCAAGLCSTISWGYMLQHIVGGAVNGGNRASSFKGETAG